MANKSTPTSAAACRMKKKSRKGKFMTKKIVNPTENVNIVTPEAELSEVNVHFNV